MMDPAEIVDKMDDIFGNKTKGSCVALLLQPSPDPDCLGAAAGLSLLLKEVYGLLTMAVHTGEVSHPQNKSLVNILRLGTQRVSSEDFKPSDYDAFIVLDTDLTNAGYKTKELPRPDVRIDHHDMNRDDEAALNDVRQVGSTCSIIWEYLKLFKISIEDHPDVATALILGIKTDTNDFSSANTSDLDFEAFRALIPCVDRDSLARINNYPIPKAVFEAEAEVLSAMHEKGSVLVSSIGTVSAHKRDIIPIIADRFIRLDNINTVVILGIVDNFLEASVRSTDSRHNVSELCAEVFGKDYSGGKEGSGGAKVPLGLAGTMVTSEEARKLMENEITQSIASAVFDSLGEN